MDTRVIVAVVVGGIIGFILAKIFDPQPPPEIVEAIAGSEWATAWAEKFCSEKLPPEKREECIRELSKKVAGRLARSLFY
ncbi:MAG: hypothetical protein DRO09_03980 [Thermoprotei archaeon]|nr:MAG: hypothetical protein DRO09_03980 [Thermoprotei archaeon]